MKNVFMTSSASICRSCAERDGLNEVIKHGQRSVGLAVIYLAAAREGIIPHKVGTWSMKKQKSYGFIYNEPKEPKGYRDTLWHSGELAALHMP